MKFFLALLLMAGITGCGKPKTALFVIEENGRYGFIDSAGEKLIPPQFENAGTFTEGLAPVRVHGLFGYIDAGGQLAIPPEYDYAQNFSNGCAVVVKDGKAFYIDAANRKLFDNHYGEIYSFSNGRGIIRTESGPVGIINKLGRLVIDTVYNNIIPTPYNSFIVMNDDYEYAIIDTTGKIRVPFGRYDKIEPYENGQALVETEDGVLGFIDSTGKYVSEERYFKADEKYNFWLVDKQGKRLMKKPFENVLSRRFKEGLAFVKENDKWGAVDSNGKFVIRPSFDFIEEHHLYDDCFFFSSYSPDYLLYGLASNTGKIQIPARFTSVDGAGFQNGLLKVVENERAGYIDRAGKYVWREGPATKDTLNIDFMNRGYFICYSLPGDNDKSGGWAVSANIPKKIERSSNFAAGKFTVVVRPQDTCTWAENYAGMKLYIANDSRDTMLFNAQDSRLDLKVQALNKNGEWKDIEYLPSSWCGNSYHTVRLPPQYYFSFAMPVYKGKIKTRLRAELSYMDRSTNKPVKIYSNEFAGSVNPAQFWRKAGYTPSNIMDPYND